MDYINRIKKLKSEKKITNDKLSELTGIPLGTLSKILAGISDSPKLSNMVLIAEALGCSLDYIVSGTPENTNNYTLSADEIAFIEDYRQLDTHGRELLSLIAQKELDRVGMLSEPAAKVARVAREKKPSVAPVFASMKGNFSCENILEICLALSGRKLKQMIESFFSMSATGLPFFVKLVGKINSSVTPFS